MAELAADRLQLPERYREMLVEILRQHAPAAEVWAYGSRVTGGGHEASDLDLVLRNPINLLEPASGLEELRQALTESHLPIRVEVLDWSRIPESFRREIERGYVVVQGEVHAAA